MIYENSLIEWIIAELSTILIANGYNSDIGNNIFIGDDKTFSACDTLPILNLHQLDTNTITAGSTINRTNPCGYRLLVNYQIEFFFPLDAVSNKYEQYNTIIRDIKKALFQKVKDGQNTFSNTGSELPGVIQMTYVRSLMPKREDSQNVNRGQLFFNIKYDQDLTDNDL